MAQWDIYREWNAFQELRAHLPELLDGEQAALYEARLSEILDSETATDDLDATVLDAWYALKDNPQLIQTLRDALRYNDIEKSVRFGSLPGPDTPIDPGPLHCCPVPSCKKTLYQLFDGQSLTCPDHKIVMKACSALSGKRRP